MLLVCVLLFMCVLALLSFYFEAVVADCVQEVCLQPELYALLGKPVASAFSHWPYKHVRLWWHLRRHPDYPQRYQLSQNQYQHLCHVGWWYYAMTTVGILVAVAYWGDIL